ncbi:FtsX-like permease family protein [Inconstantimicrobium mannanitabidum]|uniref:Peptide ABC transporter Pep4E family, permease n=1 Tax=Inconstantimicrobium mannanitabidum TaxID=1604901 RepID=A0ACB5RCT4_9CLOT|nr:ABC transporter permease [Clostridium sp. TW13]GKX67073.1 peptide ABC transporter Pep4E family, permease [Clostridium sp. TW13]
MTIRNIAIKNIKGNLNKYVMYYISNVIVVTIFFIFANFIFNPQISKVNPNTGSMGQMASEMMYLCEFVIVLFTFIFTRYSISNFLKSREKEFGLLAMFGLTKGQIRRYVMLENLIISMASIFTGIVFGILFSKLFFLAVAVILDLNSEIPFGISIKAIVITVVCFFIVFQLISFITSFKIKNNNIIELLKGERIPKITPKFSRIKATIGILLIISGYVVGIFSKALIIMTMFPILIVVIIGTYLLFSQFSVYLTSRLQRNKRVYYKGINFITLSQIVYKLKDNSKILFITSILSGITLAASVAVYSVEKIAMSTCEDNCPQDISFIEQGVNSHRVVSMNKVEDILKKSNFSIKFKNKVELLKGKNSDKFKNKKNIYGIALNSTDFNIMSQSSFNALARQYSQKTLKLNNDEVVIYTYDLNSNIGFEQQSLPFGSKKVVNVEIEGVINHWNLKENIRGGIINADKKNSNTLVINDSTFYSLWNNAADNERYIFYSYNIQHSFKAANAVEQINNLVGKEQKDFYFERVTSMATLMQMLSVILFIGTFVSAIFFIATGSILYFKMFNEIQKDKQEFIGLKKIGVTTEEIKKIVSIQIFIMFFLPLTVALLHAVFAVKSLGILYAKYFIFIAAIYLIFQTIYYVFAKWMYVRQINRWKM